MTAFQTAFAIGEEQYRIAMHRPEATEYSHRGVGQRHQAILIAFGIADMHPLTLSIDITDLKAKSFTETQAETVDGKKRTPGSSTCGPP